MVRPPRQQPGNGSERVGMGVEESEELIAAALRLLRAHLGLDVAFVSELTDEGSRVFRHVDADDTQLIAVGSSDPAEESWCHYVRAGAIPQFVSDPADHPVAARLAVTRDLPVGTHYSVPLVLSDGSTYGTFCGFCHTVEDRLHEGGLDAVRLLAAIVAEQVEQAELGRRRDARRRERLLAQHPGGGLVMAAQPIVHLASGDIAGYELLARFPDLDEGPDIVFADAWALGVGVDLELQTLLLVQAAIAELPTGCRVSVNLAPDTLVNPRFMEVLDPQHAPQMVVEITEHARVRDYQRLRWVIKDLKAMDVHIAVDDVGTGFSGLDHILRLQPDILKIDGALVRDVDRSSDKQAMLAALLAFGSRVGATLVAEQVETAEELRTLVELGVDHAQGYLLGRPGPLPTVQGAVARARW